MRIVLGIDGSVGSLRAHEMVATTQWPRGSFVRLLGVLERAAPGEELEAILDGMAEPLRRHGYAVQVRLERGLAPDHLLAASRELHADLIVVGSRGRGPAASTLLGSVSTIVADHAACPVLVARMPQVTRILLSTDGSASARAIPAILANWGIFRGAPVDVLSVAAGPRLSDLAFVTPWAVVAGEPRAQSSDTDRHQAMADEVARELAEAGWRTETLVRRGDPADEIVHAARGLGSDLIITGSRGLGDLHRLLLGSVAHDVLVRSRCSVLIMRGPVHADLRAPAQAPVGALSLTG